MRKIIDDMKAVIDGKSNLKINIYSALTLNIVGLRFNLNIFDYRIPRYTGTIIIELYKKGNKYFVKVSVSIC